MMHSFDDCYAFTGLVPEIVCLTSGNEDARNFSTAITDDGPTCIATSDESLVKFTYDGKKVKESTLCDVGHLLSSEGGKNHLIGFTSPDSNYYILIGDEIVEK